MSEMSAVVIARVVPTDLKLTGSKPAALEITRNSPSLGDMRDALAISHMTLGSRFHPLSAKIINCRRKRTFEKSQLMSYISYDNGPV